MKGFPTPEEVLAQRKALDPPTSSSRGAQSKVYQRSCGVPEPTSKVGKYEEGYDETEYNHWTDFEPMYKFSHSRFPVRGKMKDFHELTEEEWYDEY